MGLKPNSTKYKVRLITDNARMQALLQVRSNRIPASSKRSISIADQKMLDETPHSPFSSGFGNGYKHTQG
jgi:hypothetical protein